VYVKLCFSFSVVFLHESVKANIHTYKSRYNRYYNLFLCAATVRTAFSPGLGMVVLQGYYHGDCPEWR